MQHRGPRSASATHSPQRPESATTGSIRTRALYTDKGYAGDKRHRPGLCEALAVCRSRQRGKRRHIARGSRRIPKNTDGMLRRTLRSPDGAEGTQVPAVYVHFGT